MENVYCTVRGGRVLWCRTCDREVAGSNPTNQRLCTNANSACHPSGLVNEYQRKLGSKRAYHVNDALARICGLAASAGVRLRANETEISDAPWTLRLGKVLYFTLPFS